MADGTEKIKAKNKEKIWFHILLFTIYRLPSTVYPPLIWTK